MEYIDLFYAVFKHIALVILLIFVYKYLEKFYRKKMYRNEEEKADNIVFFTKIFFIIIALSYFLAYLPSLLGFNNINVTKGFAILFIAKIFYTIVAYYITTKYGREILTNIKLEKTKKLLKLLKDKQESADYDENSNRVDLNDSYFYRTSNNTFWEKDVESYTSTKRTRFINLFFFIISVSIAVIALFVVYDDLSKMSNNSVLVGFLALIFVYVLQRAYTDIYALYVIVKCNKIDIGNVINISLGGDSIEGEIIEISDTKVEVEHNFTGKIEVIPIALFLTDSVTYIPERTRFNFEYVLGIDYYKDDSGKKLKSDFISIMNQLKGDKLISNKIEVDEVPKVWVIPDNDGVKVVCSFILLKPKGKTMAYLDLHDSILSRTNNLKYDLRTPKLIELV